MREYPGFQGRHHAPARRERLANGRVPADRLIADVADVATQDNWRARRASDAQEPHSRTIPVVKRPGGGVALRAGRASALTAPTILARCRSPALPAGQ